MSEPWKVYCTNDIERNVEGTDGGGEERASELGDKAIKSETKGNNGRGRSESIFSHNLS